MRSASVHRLLTGAFLLVSSVTCNRGVANEWEREPSTIEALNRAIRAPHSLFIVAHQDDDILFMNPDVATALTEGRGVVTVFVTAGNAGQGELYWKGREAGARAAYTAMLDGLDAWREHTIALRNGALLGAYTNENRAALLFLRLPDGNVTGGGFAANQNETLRSLWDGSVGEVHAVDGSWNATRDTLVETLATIMGVTAPSSVRFLDCTGAHGRDHSDHIHSARFGFLAYQRSAGTAPFTMYRGYNISAEPPNLAPEQAAAKLKTFDAYLVHDSRQCPQQPCSPASNYVSWSERQYPVVFPDSDLATCIP